MKVNTHISNIIEGTAEKSQYDTEVKKVLSDKTILAWIMKYTVAEVKSYEIEEIRAFIDGNVEVATHLVRWGQQPEAMVGEATEDAIPGEGKITYDIRFTIQVPHLNGKPIKLIKIYITPIKQNEPIFQVILTTVGSKEQIQPLH